MLACCCLPRRVAAWAGSEHVDRGGHGRAVCGAVGGDRGRPERAGPHPRLHGRRRVPQRGRRRDVRCRRAPGSSVPACMRRVAFDPADANRVWATGPSASAPVPRLVVDRWRRELGAGGRRHRRPVSRSPSTAPVRPSPAATRCGGADASTARGPTWGSTSRCRRPRSRSTSLRSPAPASRTSPTGPSVMSCTTWMTRLTTASGWLPPQSAPRLTSVRGMVFGYDGTLWKATASGLKYGPPGAELAFIDGGVAPSTSDVALEIGHPGRLWAAANDVYRTRDNGATWTATGFGPERLSRREHRHAAPPWPATSMACRSTPTRRRRPRPARRAPSARRR